MPLKGKNFSDFREKKLLEFFWNGDMLPLKWEKLLCFREKKLLEFFRMAICAAIEISMNRVLS